MKITLFIPCYIDLCYPQVGKSIVQIFEKLGHQVECPESPACCGQPAFNTGYWEESQETAVKVLEQFRRRGSGYPIGFMWGYDKGVLS